MKKIVCVMSLILMGSTLLPLNAMQTASTPAASAASPSTSAPAGNPGKATKKSSAATPDEIAAAKARGDVWVNMETKVYHKDGQFYGTTKKGQFMSEADAVKMGAHAAKSSPVGKKKSAATPAKA